MKREDYQEPELKKSKPRPPSCVSPISMMDIDEMIKTISQAGYLVKKELKNGSRIRRARLMLLFRKDLAGSFWRSDIDKKALFVCSVAFLHELMKIPRNYMPAHALTGAPVFFLSS